MITKKQLRAYLKSLGYKKLSKLTKPQLVKLVEREIKKGNRCNNNVGSGLFSSIAKNAGLLGYKTLANIYRAKNGTKNTRPLEFGELHYGLHNFTGPGTRLDLPQVRNAKPYNDIDNCSKIHDLDYEYISKNYQGPERAKKIHEADQKAIDCYNKYKNEDGYKPALLGISGKLSLEQLLSNIKGAPSILYG